jgi:diguanylate cyclase (GGDEF)-like protein
VLELRRRERKLTRLVAERTEELRRANAELEFMANSDSLTKIGNRRRFEAFLSNEWNRALRSKSELSLVLLDIDHFKLYNDTYGHQTGDECLQRVAEALADAINRPTDLVARFGGEEFAIVLGGTDSIGARQIAAMAIENVNQMFIPHLSSSTSEFLTISAGIGTIVPGFEKSESELIRAADSALYRAKKDGRNRVLVNDLTMIPESPGILDEELLEVR